MSETGRNGQLLNESSILSSSSSLSNGGFRDTRKRNCWHQCWAWARDGFTIIACCYGILTAAITVALAFQIRFGSPQVPPAGAVASDDGECSKDAGLAMLSKGGSAVDAAVATLLCLSVTHPHLVGPGGGGVMLVHDHVQNRTRVVDFLPDIPANFDPARRTSFIGGESVGVPGFLHGLHRAHQRYGKLPWEALFSPAIEIANGGFSVSASLEDALVPLNSVFIPAPPPLFPGLEGSLKTSGGATSNTFSGTFVPFGVRLKRGATVKRIPYAQLLQKVAKFGPEVVFELDYAVEMVELLKESGSSISVADLHGYQVREYDAVWSSYSNKTVFTTPGAGDVLLAELRLLANSGVDSATPLEELYEHLVQGLKLAQPIYFKMAEQLEQRARLSAAFRNASEALDLSLVYQGVSETSRQQQPLDGQHEPQQQQQNLAALRELMDGVEAAALRRLPQHAATQVSAIDTYDLYVTAVAGLGSLFGSQLMSYHGVLFNNMLASVPLSAPSSAASQHTQGDAANTERVRPLVPYAPFILVDDLKVCGQRVVCSSSSVSDSVQVLTHHLLRGLPLTSAVAQPRVALDPSNDLVLLDDLSDGLRLSGSVRNFLISRGYQLGMNRPPYSSVNSVAKLKDETSSHSDPRGGGLAARLGSGGVDYQKGTSFSSAGVVQTGSHVGVAAGSDVGGADEHATVTALNISNPDAEFFGDAGGSDNIADEGNPHVTLQYNQDGGHVFENAPTAPDYSTDTMKKKAKESTTERSSSVNKKYIGDAGAFEKTETPSQGTGRVVKGDARGGVRLVYHELEEKLKGASSDPGADGRVNGGRGGNSSFELFNTGQPSLTSSKPATEPPLPAAPPVDSVFSDYDPLRHLSQVRVDDYQTGEEEERFTGPDGGYVQAPVNIWGHPESRLVSPPAHIAVLPGHLASQFRKQIEKQQLAEQRRQKLATHFQQQQSGQSASPLPVVFGPEQPGSGLPVIVQRHRDHSHPILGSEVSGPYEDILG